jgi:hypothetical protein
MAIPEKRKRVSRRGIMVFSPPPMEFQLSSLHSATSTPSKEKPSQGKIGNHPSTIQ